jgi:hypothetical protein
LPYAWQQIPLAGISPFLFDVASTATAAAPAVAQLQQPQNFQSSSSSYVVTGGRSSADRGVLSSSTSDDSCRQCGMFGDDRQMSPGHDVTYHGRLRSSQLEHLQASSRRFSLDSDTISNLKASGSKGGPACMSPGRGHATKYPQHTGTCNCVPVGFLSTLLGVIFGVCCRTWAYVGSSSSSVTSGHPGTLK